MDCGPGDLSYAAPSSGPSVGPGIGALFTNVAYNGDTREVWWEGRTPAPPADATGWRDWTGTLISGRPPEESGTLWAHSNSRGH